jgi:hypothetical protein
MTETTETETLPRECLIIHAFAYWHIEEVKETYCETEYLVDLVIEIQDLTEGREWDLPGWRIKDLKTKEELTGEEFLARHG